MKAVSELNSDIAGPRRAVTDHEITRGSALGNARDDKRVGADDYGRFRLAEPHLCTLIRHQVAATDLELASGYCSRRRHLHDLRIGFGRLPFGHVMLMSVKI